MENLAIGTAQWFIGTMLGLVVGAAITRTELKNIKTNIKDLFQGLQDAHDSRRAIHLRINDLSANVYRIEGEIGKK